MNPFKYGQVVLRDNYCHRPALEKTLRSKLKSGQNVCIEGERRTGKTSLVTETVRGMRGRKLLYADLLEVKTVEDIHKRVLTALVQAEKDVKSVHGLLRGIASLRPALSFDPYTGVPTVTVDSSRNYRPDSLEGLIDMLGRARSGRVVVLDEFQDILNLKESRQTLAVMRGRIEFMETVPFVFCGSIRRRMHEIFTDPESHFFKSALSLEVGSIDRGAFKKFLGDKFRSSGRRVGGEVLDRILHIARENPGDTQQMCAALYDVSSRGDTIGEKEIREALLRIFGEEHKGYESALARISGLQLKCLTTVARLGGKGTSSREFISSVGATQPSSIRKALSRLEDLKLLFRVGKEYRFTNPFFAQWLVYCNY